MSMKGVRKGNSKDNFYDALFIGSSQKLAFGSVSSQSAALGSNTSLILVRSTQNVFLNIAANPIAVADGTNYYLPSGVDRYICVTGAHKIAAIRDTADGNLFITEAASL